jgi:hypothetical protein
MRALFGLILLWLAGAATAAAPARFAADVRVERDGARWTAEFRFSGRAPVWLFGRSALTREGLHPWRLQSWRVATPGVRLVRLGHHDAFVADGGGPVPDRVLIAFTPSRADLVADYDPALIFTDGSVALYTEAFVAIPLPSQDAAARLPQDLNGIDFPAVETRMAFHDAAGPALLAGRRVAEARLRDDGGDGTYVLFGPLQPIVSDAMAEIIDPQLPGWIRETLGREVPEILGRYAATLGPAPGPRPTIMVSWGGPAAGVTSMGGSVLPGLITMAYEGDRLLAETPAARGYGLWFIAHESAHFWLGNAVHTQYSRESWITEGGADLLAFRTVAAVDPTYDWRGAIDQSIRDCASLSAGRGIADAEARNEQRAYYACGAVFALVAEAASRRPFIEFVRQLLADNRADQIVSRADWLALLDRVSHDPSLSRDIGALLDHGSTDPKAAIAALFTRAGIAFVAGPDGLPRMR